MRSWSTIAACARIRIAPGWRAATVARCSPIGGMPRPAWMSTGRRCSSASAKTGSSRSSSTVNFWARGCSLMPRAPSARQRRASSIGLCVQVEPGQRHEQAVRLGGPAEHAVVRRAVGRRAVGLVQREDERAAHVPLAHLRERRRQVERACRPRRGRGACARRRCTASGGSSVCTPLASAVEQTVRRRRGQPSPWTLSAARRRSGSAPERSRVDDPRPAQPMVDDAVAAEVDRQRRGPRRHHRARVEDEVAEAVRDQPAARVRHDRLQHVRVGAQHDVGAGGQRRPRERLLLRSRPRAQLGAPVHVDDDDIGLRRARP